MIRVSEVDPKTERSREDLARIAAYFGDGEMTDADRDWVQQRAIGFLYAEVERLRGVVARLEAGGR